MGNWIPSIQGRRRERLFGGRGIAAALLPEACGRADESPTIRRALPRGRSRAIEAALVEILPEAANAFVQVMKTSLKEGMLAARIMCATSDAVEAWFEDTIPTAWHSNIPLSSDAHQLSLQNPSIELWEGSLFP
jgi:hypothetical protein